MATVHYLSRDQKSALADSGDPFGWPGTPEGWQDRYQYLLDAFHGETYSHQLCKDLQLFRALDDNGATIAITRRLYRDRIFLVEVAAAALALGQVTLQPTESANEADVETAKAVWKRSEMHTQGEVWSLSAAIYGDLLVEPVRMASQRPYRTELVSHDARTVVLEYDPIMGRRIDKATITHEVLGEASVDARGHAVESGTLDHHQRTLDSTDITISETRYNPSSDSRDPINEEGSAAQSGPHGLGITPLCHGRFLPSPMEPEHSLAVTHGLDRAEAEINSLASQVSAIGDRYGNPKLFIKGVKVGEGTALLNLGKILNIFGGSKDALANSDAKYLEPNLAGVAQIREQMIRLVSDVRATFPEFLFSTSTANLSAEALRLLSTRYETKYTAIRRRIYGCIEKALAKAVALETNRPYDPDSHPVTLEGPPLLPADTMQALEEIIKAKEAGLITLTDAVKHTQALGLADADIAPEEYAKEIMDEAADRATTFFEDPEDAGAEQPDEPDDDADDEA